MFRDVFCKYYNYTILYWEQSLGEMKLLSSRRSASSSHVFAIWAAARYCTLRLLSHPTMRSCRASSHWPASLKWFAYEGALLSSRPDILSPLPSLRSWLSPSCFLVSGVVPLHCQLGLLGPISKKFSSLSSSEFTLRLSLSDFAASDSLIELAVIS